eukprot:m.18010 g.18010  ORF g.18010 m.18010 type:complete len:343 (+) comp10731_c0_seq2:49-1077(+)
MALQYIGETPVSCRWLPADVGDLQSLLILGCKDGLIQVAETSRRATDEHGIHEEISLDIRAELDLEESLVHVQPYNGVASLAALENGDLSMVNYNLQNDGLELQHTLIHPLSTEKDMAVNALAINSTQHEAVTVTQTGSIHVHKFSDSNYISSSSFDTECTCSKTAVVYTDSQHIATGNDLGAVRLFDLQQTTAPTMTMRLEPEDGNLPSITSILQHPARPETLIVGTRHGVIATWDLRQPTFPVALTQAHEAEIWDLAFHPVYTDHFFSAGQDGFLLHWSSERAPTTGRAFALDATAQNIQVNNLLNPNSPAVNTVAMKDDVLVAGLDSQALFVASLKQLA